MDKKTIASDSGHWYDKAGRPAYTIIGANGKERPTTLRDARKLSLVPSVTTIMKIMAKPGLELWKQNQILMAALTLPSVPGETSEELAKRIKIDASEHAKNACDKGTTLHGILERYYQTGISTDHLLTGAVDKKLVEEFGDQEWLSEKSFSRNGVGGKVDLHSKTVLVDFKTTEFDKGHLPRGWPEQVQQLAAYADGLGLRDGNNFPVCANVYISTSTPGLVHIKKYKNEEMIHGYEVFAAIFDLWKKIKKYNPEA